MSLIKREPSPGQSLASHANSLHSTGPCSEQGKAVSSRNALKPRLFSQVIARSLQVLGESPGDFERTHQALAQAMEPRDAWEAAWVQDIANLRWRLERLQRAEVGVAALRRRRLQHRRFRATVPPTGSAAIQFASLAGLCGFAGLPDSLMKFQQVITIFNILRDMVRAELFDKDFAMYFSLLYGKAPGPNGAILKSHFESAATNYNEKDPDSNMEERKSLDAELGKEIADWEKLQTLYAAEHLDADPLQEDAELLLPPQELDEIIRYETHLEDQIERKLRQFYARRRESVLRRAESQVSQELEAPELAHSTASVGA